MVACEQALLFGRAKRAARELTSEVPSPRFRVSSRVYFLLYPQMESLLAGYHSSGNSHNC